MVAAHFPETGAPDEKESPRVRFLDWTGVVTTPVLQATLGEAILY